MMIWVRRAIVFGLFGWAYGAGTSGAVLALLVYLLVRIEVESHYRERFMTGVVDAQDALLDLKQSIAKMDAVLSPHAPEDSAWSYPKRNVGVVGDKVTYIWDQSQQDKQN